MVDFLKGKVLQMPEGNRFEVSGQGGFRGRLFGSVLYIDGTQYRLIRTDSGRDYLIPAGTVRLRDDGSYSLTLTPEQAESYAVEKHLERDREQRAPAKPPATGTDEIVIPIVAEQMHVSKQTAERDRLRVHKRVKEFETVVDEPVFTEKYVVRRVPVNKAVDGPVETRVAGDTIIVPLLEEVIVTQKRLMLREELHITRTREEGREPRTVKLRKEYVEIERVRPAGS